MAEELGWIGDPGPQTGGVKIRLLPKYRCPKHGDVGELTIGFALGEPFSHVDGNRCLVCYAEMVAEKCEQVTEIPAD